MRLPDWHRTKIICTLGPATDAPRVVEGLVSAGMDLARINLSHGSHSDHARRIAAVRQAAGQIGQPMAILADLPGPKFRLATLAQGVRELRADASVILGPDAIHELPVRDPRFLAALKVGDRLYLADGAVEMVVTASSALTVTCQVLIGGEVRSGSGIHAPEADLGISVPTDDDRRHLSFALDQRAEWIGVSFVQRAEDLARVRTCFPIGSDALLMAKIEKRRAIAELEAIVESADGIMVARGDLGVETDIAEIPLLQKRIIAAANARGRPVVTATQMLESMVQNERPTRAEVTDVANAVLDGTDAVMLSAETAIGLHPVSAVEVLSRVITATEAAPSVIQSCVTAERKPPEVADALGFAACQLAARIGAAAIIAVVHDFATATTIARFRPRVPLVILTESQALCRALVAIRGIAPLYSASGNDAAHSVDGAGKWLRARGLGRSGSPAILLLAAHPCDQKLDSLQMVSL